MRSWDSDQYLRFSDERSRPCSDLLARITVESPRRVIDLGCGPGNSTSALFRRWPSSAITGLDNSPEMITAARGGMASIDWRVGDISGWSDPIGYDVVFSNAALQWVPDHTTLLPRLLKSVSPGGAFAMQIPMNLGAPAHRLMRELAASATWRIHFPDTVREWFVHRPEDYYDMLSPGSRSLDIWSTTYLHILPDHEAIVEWYKGTGLRPFLQALREETLRSRFLSDYLALLPGAYPNTADGKVPFPFHRFFAIAYR